MEATRDAPSSVNFTLADYVLEMLPFAQTRTPRPGKGMLDNSLLYFEACVD